MVLRRCLLVIIFLFTTPLYAFSNLIVFGDSLSDVGNFPETIYPFKNPDAAKIVSNTNSQFYVPFSNPVDTNSKPPESYSAWPAINELYAEDQVVIFPSKSNRKYRSFSWAQFFLEAAKESHSTQATELVPSVLLNQRIVPENFSYDYAWGFATSDSGCTNPQYRSIGHCTEDEINAARAKYLKTFSLQDYQQLLIPGVQQQVNFFINDIKTQKIVVDHDTIYVFYIGGNDLIIAGNALEKHYNPFPAFKLILGLTASHVMSAVSDLLSNIPKDQHPKVIYVFNQFNPAITPGYYHKPISNLAGMIIDPINFWLTARANIHNWFSNTKIKIITISDFYENAAKLDYYKNNLGKACMIDNGSYTNPVSIPRNNCAGYIFWNDVHPSSDMNAMIGSKFFKVAF